MSCLKAGHILSNGLKITIFCFSSVVNVNHIWNTGKNWSFAILQRQHVCTASYSCRVKILVTGFLFKRFIMANFNPYQFTNLRYSPDYSQYGDGLFAPFGSQIFFDQCQRKVKHLKNQYKEKKDWNRRQSGGNLRKSPHYDIIDSVLGCRDIITCNNVEQAGTQAAENSGSSANSPETSAAEASSSSSSAGRTTPTTAGSSVARRRERKKVKGQKRPARVHDSDSEDDTIGEAIKKLATEGEQMASFMERMQDSQGQQIQLMFEWLGTF